MSIEVLKFGQYSDNIMPTENFDYKKQLKDWDGENNNPDEEDDIPSPAIRLIGYVIDSVILIFITAKVIERYDPDWKVLLLIPFSYYLVFEWVWAKTIGKFITGTRIVKKENKDIELSMGNVFIRTLCRFIPFEGLSYFNNPNGWHDDLAGTKVIRERQSKKPTFEELGHLDDTKQTEA